MLRVRGSGSARNKSRIMEPSVVFADEYLIVIDKPAGWVVNDAQSVKEGKILQSYISQNFDFEIAKSREYRSGIVHRLDKDTSGLLLIAKTPETFAKLQAEFKSREVVKGYLALVHGEVREAKGEINAPVGRLPWNRERFGVFAAGREAQTAFEVIDYYQQEDGGKFTLLSLSPKTGRTHQIRVHMKYLGHPVVSDLFYAGRKQARHDRAWCPRLFLHAAKITFRHPMSGEVVHFESRLPDDLQEALEKLLNLA